MQSGAFSFKRLPVINTEILIKPLLTDNLDQELAYR